MYSYAKRGALVSLVALSTLNFNYSALATDAGEMDHGVTSEVTPATEPAVQDAFPAGFHEASDACTAAATAKGVQPGAEWDAAYALCMQEKGFSVEATEGEGSGDEGFPTGAAPKSEGNW